MNWISYNLSNKNTGCQTSIAWLKLGLVPQGLTYMSGVECYSLHVKFDMDIYLLLIHEIDAIMSLYIPLVVYQALAEHLTASKLCGI